MLLHSRRLGQDPTGHHLAFCQRRGQKFDRVVIETTGLADPAPNLHTLMTDEFIASRYRLDGVIAVVDIVNGSTPLIRIMRRKAGAQTPLEQLRLKASVLASGALLGLLQQEPELDASQNSPADDNGADPAWV